jgi:hypothetical protein
MEYIKYNLTPNGFTMTHALIHGNGNCQLKVFSTSLANTLSCSAHVLVQLECCGFFLYKISFLICLYNLVVFKNMFYSIYFEMLNSVIFSIKVIPNLIKCNVQTLAQKLVCSEFLDFVVKEPKNK